ncbi:MAG TPA: 3'-5' exonuclease, partial [Rhabdochlamydiaceae bacterium]
DFTIYDEDDSEKLLKECFAALNIKDEKGLLKSARAAISHAKNFLEEPANDPIYNLYQSKLKSYQALDFDDLLFLTVKLFKEFPDQLEVYQKRWTFLLIDEYQDTNTAQSTLIRLLAHKHHNVFAVGDPDQSIYSWRGADVSHILKFKDDYPGAQIVRLEQNYRSRNIILKAANALIQHNTGRLEKNLWSARGEGEKIGLYICPHEHAETEFIIREIQKSPFPLSECVIFYRTHFQSRVFEDALLRHRIPYRIIGGLSFYQRREVKDILSLLRIVLAGADFLSFARTVNIPKRGLGDGAVSKIQAFAEERLLPIFQAAEMIVDRKELKLSQKQYEGLRDYVEMIRILRTIQPLSTLLAEAIERSRYLTYLKDDPETEQERKENLQELIAKAVEWEQETETPTLAAFLEELTLKSAKETDTEADAIRLMTFHNGKGLEFDLVFLVGMEEDLFPHVNCRDNPESLEEERRLCYVGMTRAKESLYLTASRHRFLWGASRPMRPSRFLYEIPSEYLRTFDEGSGDENVFSPGTAVVHKDFGPGIVQKSYQTSLGLTYDVFFPKANATRTLIAKYAKLSS